MTVAEAVTLIASVGAFVVAVTGAFVSVWNAIHIGQVHTIVNSQSTKFEELQRRVGYGEGERAEIRRKKVPLRRSLRNRSGTAPHNRGTTTEASD